MNRKKRRRPKAAGNNKADIQFGGKAYSLQQAHYLAMQSYKLSNYSVAEDIYRLILAAESRDIDAHNNLGVILQGMRRYDEALASYDKAIAIKPDFIDAYSNRGMILCVIGRYEEALASYDKVIALNPDYAEAYNNRGITLERMMRCDEAIASYEKAIALNPHNAEAFHNCGDILVSKGRIQEAETMVRKALALKPDFSKAYYNITHMQQYSVADCEDARNIQGLLSRPVAPPDKEYLYYSLGKIFDDCGLYDQAFLHYQKANQISKAKVSYDASYVAGITRDTIEVFSKDFLAEPFAYASESQPPLFIVGMPRSGTTLIASILSSHPAIETAGELATIFDSAERLKGLVGNGIPYPQAVKHMRPDIASMLIADYEKRLRRDVAAGSVYIIDKHPMNFMRLGFVSLLFPRARIIHCTRHPLDTAISNYFARFDLRYNYCFDLHDIGNFYKEYATIMEHWLKVLPTPMLEVSYEDAISNTQETISRMLCFLKLDWDDRCLSPHTNPGIIETASKWQVRQPIYKKSVGRWRHYEKHLQPLKEVLFADSQGI